LAIVVAKATLATAPNTTNITHTIGTSSPGNGYSLPEIREETNSAAGYNLNDNLREIGGRSITPTRSVSSLRHNTTQPETSNTAPPLSHITPRVHKGKRTKATLRIASLNMRGRGIEKWHYINQLLRDKKIGILALQEAHLLDCHIAQLHELYPKRLHILHSSDSNAPNTKGVAIVLNKEITNTSNLSMYNIHPGRALLLEKIDIQTKNSPY
jgi:hypothetical protein